LELSSFQLETTSSLSPTVATVLNVSPNHLDWHQNIESYVHAKSRIFHNGGEQVLNRDDPLAMAMQISPAVRTFGASETRGGLAWGLRINEGTVWLPPGRPG